ncbi:type III-B CRISPR module RAMP protein Cmr6 [Fervidobacterium islandicum]|uniref:type III-B CRISPR module RAMP protein Cmr6 n=1 Tax=Fervidobacterium islandicum TaxID=2423 RepID=UPI003A78F6D5
MSEPTQNRQTMVINNKSLYWDKLVYIDQSQNIIQSYQKSKPLIIKTILQQMKNTNSLTNTIQSLHERRNLIVQSFEKKFTLIDKDFKLKTKMLLGSGLPSLIEVGMHLSRNYGLPVIPGTSIKGAFAHFLEGQVSQELYKKIFGTELSNNKENVRGGLIFLDALPNKDLKFEIDLLNNHFQPYYMENDAPPNDWYDPVPISYIVVGEGTFRFTILINKEVEFTSEEADKIKKKFIEMLKTYGIGAKTNYGYGRFEEKV